MLTIIQVGDAIRRMRADEERAAAFRKAVAEGEAQLDRGEGTEYSRGRMNKLADSAHKNLRGCKPVDPDTIP